MTLIRFIGVLPIVILLTLSAAFGDDALWRRQIQYDWLLQEQFNVGAKAPAANRAKTKRAEPKAKLTKITDAAGGVDGVKNGLWGFHTASEADPWWQVDMGKSQPVGRLVAWNRCDSPGLAARTSGMVVLLSDDAKTWRKVYTHDEKTFGGLPDKKPLTVKLVDQSARYVRLWLAGKTYFHLDEVEIFAPGGTKNLALRRPANQSSISQWSHAGPSTATPVAAPKRTRRRSNSDGSHVWRTLSRNLSFALRSFVATA